MKTNTVPSKAKLSAFGRGKVPLSEFCDEMHNFIDEACHNYEDKKKLQKEVKSYREKNRRLTFENETLKRRIDDFSDEHKHTVEMKDKEIDELKRALSRAKSRIVELQYAESQRSKSLTITSDDPQLPMVYPQQTSLIPDFAIIDSMRDDNLYSELVTGKALVYWTKLVQAGFLTPDLKLAPGISRHVASHIAYQFDIKLKLRRKWSPFERLWNIRNLRQDFERKVIRDESKLKELYRLFS